MKRHLKYIAVLGIFLSLLLTNAQSLYSDSSSSSPSGVQTVTEDDGIPSGRPKVIKFSNGSLVFNLDGSASITSGGATSWEDLTDSTTINAMTFDGLDTGDFIRTYDVYGAATLDASDTILFRDTITGNYYRGTVQDILDLAPGAAELNNLEVITTGLDIGEVPIGSAPGVAIYRQLATSDLSDSQSINAATLNNYTSNDFADSQLSNTVFNNFDPTDFADSTHHTTHEPGGTDEVNLASTDLTDSTTINAFTLNGFSSNDFADSTVVGGGTLDTAYDFGGAGAGRTITADTGAVTINGSNNTALSVNQASNQRGAEIISSATTNAFGALYVSVPSLTTGRGVFITSTSADTGAYDLVTINDQSGVAGKTSTALRVVQSGPTTALKVQSGNPGATGIDVAHEGLTSRAINVVGDLLTSGSLARFYSNSPSTTGRNLFSITNNSAASIGVGDVRCAKITQRGDGYALDIESDSEIYESLNITASGMKTGRVMSITGPALTTGRLAYFYSAATGTGTRSLVQMYNFATTSTGTTVLDLTNNADGGGAGSYCINANQNSSSGDAAFRVVSQSLVEPVITLASAGTTGLPVGLGVQANSLTTGTVFQAQSNGGATLTGSIAKLNATNISNTGTCLILNQVGTGGTHMQFTGDGEKAISTPLKGELWFNENSKKLNFFDGTDTWDLIHNTKNGAGMAASFTSSWLPSSGGLATGTYLTIPHGLGSIPSAVLTYAKGSLAAGVAKGGDPGYFIVPGQTEGAGYGSTVNWDNTNVYIYYKTRVHYYLNDAAAESGLDNAASDLQFKVIVFK